jgi:hypothetical protein
MDALKRKRSWRFRRACPLRLSICVAFAPVGKSRGGRVVRPSSARWNLPRRCRLPAYPLARCGAALWTAEIRKTARLMSEVEVLPVFAFTADLPSNRVLYR